MALLSLWYNGIVTVKAHELGKGTHNLPPGVGCSEWTLAVECLRGHNDNRRYRKDTENPDPFIEMDQEMLNTIPITMLVRLLILYNPGTTKVLFNILDKNKGLNVLLSMTS